MIHQKQRKGVLRMSIRSSFQQMLPYLTPELQTPLRHLPEQDSVQEIRLRCGRPMQAVRGGSAFTVTAQGLCTGASGGIPVTGQAIEAVFRNVCAHSVHSFQDAIRQGFVTIAGGSRVGICGTAVIKSGQLDTVRSISGLNLRIASERRGCAESLAERIGNPRQTGGILLAGAPASGKTTILRDLARIYGETMRVCVLDERGEIAAVRNGIPQFALGMQTDVFDGYPKAEAIAIAVRVMSPELLICDEIGTEEEADALLRSMHTGVTLIASAHAGSLQALRMRPQIRRLTDAGVFRQGYLLGTGKNCGELTAFQKFGGDHP